MQQCPASSYHFRAPNEEISWSSQVPGEVQRLQRPCPVPDRDPSFSQWQTRGQIFTMAILTAFRTLPRRAGSRHQRWASRDPSPSTKHSHTRPFLQLYPSTRVGSLPQPRTRILEHTQPLTHLPYFYRRTSITINWFSYTGAASNRPHTGPRLRNIKSRGCRSEATLSASPTSCQPSSTFIRARKYSRVVCCISNRVGVLLTS